MSSTTTGWSRSNSVSETLSTSPRALAAPRRRPAIAFFDYPDVFEDFYPHYGVDQDAFATRWSGTWAHAVLALLQREVGDVTWYSFSIAPTAAEARHDAGFRVRLVPSSWAHRGLWRAFYLPRSAWRWRRAYPTYALLASYLSLASIRVARTVGRDRPDMLLVQDYATGRFDVLVLLARALGVPLVAFHAGSDPGRYVGRALKRWTIPRADLLLVSGDDERDRVVERYGVPAERVRVILTPIDTSRFAPVERGVALERAGLDPSRRYLLFTGRLDDRVKRVSAVIQAFARVAGHHPGADLVVAGDGPDRDELVNLAEALAPGRVLFRGWTAGTDLVHLYASAECLVLPSASEGFPTVVGEALACGTPVVASRVGGVPELVADGDTGWLVPPGDDDALAERLGFVLSHRDVLAEMRPRARDVAQSRVAPPVIAAELRAAFAALRQSEPA